MGLPALWGLNNTYKWDIKKHLRFVGKNRHVVFCEQKTAPDADQ